MWRGHTWVHALVEPALFIRRQSIGPPLGVREPKVRGGRHREKKGAFEHHCRVLPRLPRGFLVSFGSVGRGVRIVNKERGMVED